MTAATPDHVSAVRPTTAAGDDRWPIAPLWTVDDVSAFLQIPVQTLYTWRKHGTGPQARKIGKYLRYRPDEVIAWVDSLGDPAA